jgi:multiple sugar transport system ATP-binding protein
LQRGIDKLFQTYAPYTQMTVRDHPGFAPKMANIPADLIEARVDEAACSLKIEPVAGPQGRPTGGAGG